MRCEDIKKELEKLVEYFECEEFENFILVNTPFEYQDGDLIQLYILKNEKNIIITDFGETISNLMSYNFDIFKTKKREKIFNQIINNLNIKFINGELRMENPKDLTESIIKLTEACLRVGDLIFTHKVTGKPTFKEEVSSFLLENKIPFKEPYYVRGGSNTRYKVDFYVYISPPGLLQTLSSRSEAYAEILVDKTFTMWYDLSEYNYNYKRMTLIDDTHDVWKTSKLGLLKKFSNVYYWSERDELKEDLTTAIAQS